MSEKIYFCLLILCGHLSQVIPGVFSENVDESNTLIRRKRVINLEEDTPVVSGVAPYVVNIRELPGNFTVSVGAIISRHTVITVATFVDNLPVTSIKMLVGSAYSYRARAQHDVRQKIIYPHRQPVRQSFALLIAEQPFDFAAHTGPIALHQGPLFSGTLASVYGWGCNPTKPRGTNYRNRLRVITVPIMNHQECVNIYHNHIAITESEICTYDANKYCGHRDFGAPLVVDNQLAGLYLRTGSTSGPVNPDVFIVVQYLEYSRWIRTNIAHDI